MSNHYVPDSCQGEQCGMCGAAETTHKVGEEALVYDGFSLAELQENPRPDPYRLVNMRHNLTAYVCCECFGKIMGRTAREWCGIESAPPEAAAPQPPDHQPPSA